MVRDAIASIFSRKELTINTTRAEQVKRYATELLSAIDSEEFRPNFEAFSMDLLTSLKSVFQCSKPTTVPKIKERIWIRYAEIRANKLPVVWNAFLTSISRTHLGSETLLTELVNEQLMEGLMINTFKVFKEPSVRQNIKAPVAVLSKDEENILRYASGYVIKKLHHKYIQQHGDKAAAFTECIARMQSGHEDNKPLSSFIEYTTQ